MPATSVSCPSCQAVLKLPENFTPGATARCPKCRTPVTLPASSQAKTHSALEGDGSRHEPTEAPEERVDESSYLEAPKAPGELGWLGSFRIVGRLGEGGMGIVYEAEDAALRRRVALKVMLPKHAANATSKARFLREARAQAAVEHEHVAAIHLVGDDQAVPYIAMPLLKGQTLQAALKANPRPPAVEVIRIGREMAEGLAAAHEVGLIHRDIKPGNVWLEGAKRKVKILDFGLARAAPGAMAGVEESDGPKTQQGAILGTPAYMSPEQGRGEELDARSDLFSLGVVLYEMATGERPFKGKDVWGILTSLAVDVPAPPRVLNPAIPEVLSALILTLLAKKPAERPASGEAVAAELERIEESSKRLPVAVAAVPMTNDPWADIDATDPGERGRVSAPSDRPTQHDPRTLGALTRPRSPGLRWVLIATALLLPLVGVGIWFASREKPAPPPVVEATKPPPPKKIAPPPQVSEEEFFDDLPGPMMPVDPNEAAIIAKIEVEAKQQQQALAAKLNLPVVSENSLGMKMVLIPPAAESSLKPFYVGQYEVTQGEWKAVMGYNPSQFKEGNAKVSGLGTTKFPVERVNWFDCIEFCNKLSEKEGLAPYYELMVAERKGASIEKAEVKVLGGSGYKLPTDAEWTRACTAGAKGMYHFGNDESFSKEYAWTNVNAGARTHRAGELKPNAYGLHDIHGNIREWNEEILRKADGAPERVSRGGAWSIPARICAVRSRYSNGPAYRYSSIGLRLGRTAEPGLTPADSDAQNTSAKQLQAEWAAKLMMPVEPTSPSGIALVLIPPGDGVEKPFLLGKYEVTQGEWEKLMGYNPSEFKVGNAKLAGQDASKFPVEKVNWFDAVEFCNKLSEKEGLPPYYELMVETRTGKSIENAEVKILGGKGYHLPTDAEWTWACAAGAKGTWHFGSDESKLPEYAWFDQNSDRRTHAVGEKKPNAFGLHDMHGNVREWNEEILKKADGAPERETYGGNWLNLAAFSAVSHRSRSGPATRHIGIGFRLVRVP